jgi:hypothetical protein
MNFRYRITDPVADFDPLDPAIKKHKYSVLKDLSTSVECVKSDTAVGVPTEGCGSEPMPLPLPESQ